MIIERLSQTDCEARSRIVAPLAGENTWQNFALSSRYVVLSLRDEAGIEGGLIAQIYWDWMLLEVVAVPEKRRGEGLGRALIEEAERIAQEAGCIGAWVDTYSFQSPGFYEAIGYRVFGRLPDYPKGHSRIFFAKRFDGAAIGQEE